MAKTNIETTTTGLGVPAHYGAIDSDLQRSSNGHMGGNKYRVELAFRGDDIAQTASIPEGAIITRVYVDVKEAFALAGTSPTVDVGTDGSETTNGFEISEANIETVGRYDYTSSLQGTWDAEAPLAASTTVGIDLGGTSPVLTEGQGHAVITIEYTAVSGAV